MRWRSWPVSRIRCSLWAGIVIACVFGSVGCRRSQGGRVTSPQAVPQQVIVNFTIRETQQGKLLWTLTAQEARVFEAQDITDLDSPYWEYFHTSTDTVKGQTVQKTRLRGKQGKLHLKQHDLDIRGQVVVKSDNGSLLETEELQYLAGPQRIVSHVAVKLTRPDSITTGIGLEATPDLKLVTIQKERVEVKR
ncbi:MAG: LPS export ABC transporter periplasmic protein LptC [Elusimicrobia bacterium]|nr:LPS export ABC transporter periplasmic protein LptC [Elusimicrobiota bacterium]